MERIPLPPFPRRRSAPPSDPELSAAALALRPATSGDLPLLARLYAGFRNAELLLSPWSATERQAFFDDQFRLQHRHFVRRFPRADFWIVCRDGIDGAPAGRLYLDRSVAEWRLVDILLAPEARNRGIGTALIRWAQAHAVRTGAAGIALHVALNNPRAHALYTRMGFVERDSVDGSHIPMVWRAAEP